MVSARKYIVNKHFKGSPKREDFEIVEQQLPDLQTGEVLVKSEWISVDPYIRLYNSDFSVPYDQFGFVTGSVIDSKSKDFPVGTIVTAHNGWCDYFVMNTEFRNSEFDFIYKTPNLRGLPLSLSIGALGPVGATAYFGFLSICQPKAGETVVITTAAGAVGSLVGQIAKIKGCKVIGYTGSDEKVKWLEELGFDNAYNYKTVDVTKTLKEAAPQGVDCYFDNVGGEIASIIINQMNSFGRISICGCISAYNEDMNELPKVPLWQVDVLKKQLKVEGFIVHRWFDQWPEAIEELVKWILSGKIKYREHITKGFENLFDAFVGLLSGENIGKALVKV